MSREFDGHGQDRLDGLTVDCGDWWFNLCLLRKAQGDFDKWLAALKPGDVQAPANPREVSCLASSAMIPAIVSPRYMCTGESKRA